MGGPSLTNTTTYMHNVCEGPVLIKNHLVAMSYRGLGQKKGSIFTKMSIVHWFYNKKEVLQQRVCKQADLDIVFVSL